jgi:hypothetical protein
MMSRRLWIYVTLAAATAVLTIFFALEAIWYMVAMVVMSGLIWVVGEWMQWRWLSTIAFMLMVLAAMVSAFFETGVVWGITAVTLALISWDVGRLDRFLAQTEHVEGEAVITSQYWRRLLIVAFVGFALALSATYIRLEFGFLVALPLSCLSIIGFSLAISFLRRHSD